MGEADEALVEKNSSRIYNNFNIGYLYANKSFGSRRQ